MTQGFEVKTERAPHVDVSFKMLQPIAQVIIVVSYLVCVAAVFVGWMLGWQWLASFGMFMGVIGSLVESAAWRWAASRFAAALFVSMEIAPQGATVSVVKVTEV